jgi:predicted Zn-dependent protease
VGPRHENHCIPAQGLHSFVISAHIQLSDDVQQHDNPTSLIAHELGHALGFSHIDIQNDVMYGD